MRLVKQFQDRPCLSKNHFQSIYLLSVWYPFSETEKDTKIGQGWYVKNLTSEREVLNKIKSWLTAFSHGYLKELFLLINSLCFWSFGVYKLTKC